jgi:predicted PolB exonuclease-like 3'-5' exonuclease
MAGPRKLLVFDLETVPDVDFVHRLWPQTAEMDHETTVQHLYETMKQLNGGSDFPRPHFHKIVAIGCLLADIDYDDNRKEIYTLRRLGCVGEGDDERKLLADLLDFGAKEPLRLVSFNGRGFDLPVIKIRSLAHGLSAEWLFQSGDKWSNYSSRYDMVWHVDMADVLADFGATRPCKLDEVCTLIGLPGKLDISGGKVYELHREGKLQEIRDYCETDVLNTYLLYQRYQHLAGVVSDDALANEEAHVMKYCEDEGAKTSPNRPHLHQFLKAWKG